MNQLEVAGAPDVSSLSPPSDDAAAGAPAFDRPLTFTLYDNAFDREGKPITATWGGVGGWAEALTTHEIRGTPDDRFADEAYLKAIKNGACVVLGAIAPGQTHANNAVDKAHALGIDLDEATDADVAAVIEAIAEYEWVFYTTHTHGTELAGGRSKLRFVLPTREPYDPARHRSIWKALQTLIGGRSDKATKNVARLFFLPSTFDPAIAQSGRNHGKWIDVDVLAKAYTPTEPEPSATSGVEVLYELLRTGRVGVDDDGNDLTAAARAIYGGLPFAPRGKRHQIALGVGLWLARRTKDAPIAGDAIREVFARSYAALEERDGEAPDVEDAVRCYESGVEKVSEWEAIAKAEREEKAAERQLAVGAAAGQGPYTDAELAWIARMAGVSYEEGGVATALRRRWIVQAGDQAYYILAASGGYKGPFGPSMGRTAAVELLARAPVMLNEVLRTGGIRRRGMQELAEEYGMCATEVIVDLTRDRGHFDEPARRLYEAARPLRQIAPKYDDAIDGWLRAFAGAQYEKLCDWLACVYDLKKLLCALYIDGEPGAGKTALAYGLAKAWTDGNPAEIEKVLMDFNDELVRCPLTLADEALPRMVKGNSVTTKLRSMLSTQDRTVSRKYLANATLRGSVRLIIAANNEFLLSSKDLVSSQDVEAIAQRFLYIRAPKAATEIFAALPRPERDRWLAEGIAAHAMALAERRDVKPGRRFWVEGDVSTMHRLLTLQNEGVSRVCEMLARILDAPERYKMHRQDEMIQWGQGAINVNAQGIIDAWSQYFPETNFEPEAQKIGSALRAISLAERPQIRVKDKRYRYYRVKPDMVLAWCELNGIGDRAAINRAIWDGATVPLGEPGAADDYDAGQVLEPVAMNQNPI